MQSLLLNRKAFRQVNSKQDSSTKPRLIKPADLEAQSALHHEITGVQALCYTFKEARPLPCPSSPHM
jgi:hypothetical protein